MAMTFRRRWRPALALAAALLPALPLHAEPAATQAFISSYEADLRLLYDEAVAIGPDTFTFYLHMSGNEAAVRTLAGELAARPGLALHQVARLQPQQMRAYATPALLRDELRKLKPGGVSPVFQPFKGQWALVELKEVDRRQPMPTFESLRDSLLRLVGIRALPDAASLRSRTPEQQQSAQLARAANLGNADALPTGPELDKPLSSGYSLLQRALREDNLELVRQLLARKADPNRCYMDACPLHIALDSQANALAYTELLLAAGARPDQLPGLPVQNTALVLACQRNRLDVAKALLARGADPTGKGSQHKPLDIALANKNLELQRLLLNKGIAAADTPEAPTLLHLAMAAGNRELAQALLDKGADPLARRPLPDSTTVGTPIDAALAAGRDEDAAWLRGLVAKKLAAKGKYRFAAWVEQEVLAPPSPDPNAPLVQILRQPLRHGSRVTINRERFELHVRLQPGAELRLEAATGPGLFDEVATPGAPLLDRRRLRADASRPGPLLVGEAGARAARPASTGGLVAMAADKGHCDRVEKSPEGPVCVRIIDSVRLDRGAGEATLPLEKSGLRELSVVMGIAAEPDAPGSDLVNAQKVTLVFR